MVVGMLLGLVVGVVLRNRAVNASDDERSSDAGLPLWAHYPHARREMLREIAFLAPAAVFGLAGYLIADGAVFATDPPLWVRALGGSLLGYLIGGGVVWAVRILGTLGFGKEAMGLGDVHLMAAIGACLGWINPTLAFFVAPFLAIGWAVVAALLSRWKANPPSLVLPYGPYLCVAAVLVLTLDPIVEQLLSELLGRPILLP
jgi:leader peptidase (prepilin peptidase)/N-methyltransferase